MKIEPIYTVKDPVTRERVVELSWIEFEEGDCPTHTRKRRVRYVDENDD